MTSSTTRTMTQWHPHSTVATLVERDGRFLVVEESVEGRIVYNQPAGHLENGESLIEAAIRETLEETAWRVEPTALLGLYQYRSASEGVTYIRSCFIARAVEHFAGQALDSGIVQALWLTREELLERQSQLRSPLVLRMVDDFLAGRSFPLNVIQQVD